MRRLDGAWLVDFRFRHPDGRRERVRKQSPVNTKTGAKEYERQLKESLLDYGTAEVKPPCLTVREFSEIWMRDFVASRVRPSGVTGKRSHLRKILEDGLADLPLDQVTRQHVDLFARSRSEAGNSAKTVNNYLATLRKLLKTAEQWGHISRAPQFEQLPVGEQKVDWLDHQSTEALIAATEEAWRPMVALAVNTGLRLGELRALRWADVGKDRLQVCQSIWQNTEPCAPKNGKIRTVPLNASALEALRLQPRALGSEFVFAGNGAAARTLSACEWRLEKASKTALGRRIGWHVLRHTFASHLAQAGVSLLAIRELLGHSSLKMVLRYAHLCPQVHRDAVEKIGQYLGSADHVSEKAQ